MRHPCGLELGKQRRRSQCRRPGTSNHPVGECVVAGPNGESGIDDEVSIGPLPARRRRDTVADRRQSIGELGDEPMIGGIERVDPPRIPAVGAHPRQQAPPGDESESRPQDGAPDPHRPGRVGSSRSRTEHLDGVSDRQSAGRDRGLHRSGRERDHQLEVDRFEVGRPPIQRQPTHIGRIPQREVRRSGWVERDEGRLPQWVDGLVGCHSTQTRGTPVRSGSSGRDRPNVLVDRNGRVWSVDRSPAIW